MRIDERGLKAAAIALANIHQYNVRNEETDADAKRIIEAYEEAKFRNIELPKRPWFAAEFDFHRAMGMGKNTDDALWESIQTYQGMIQHEAALWRPIEESPRNGQEFYVYIHGNYIQHGMMVWKEGCLRTPLGHIVETDIEHLSRDGAIFRTIDPPPKP